MGWKHESQWRLASAGPDAPPVSKMDYRRAQVRRRWAQLGLAAIGLATLAWMLAHAS